MKENRNRLGSNMMLNTAGTMAYFFCQWLLTVLVVKLGSYEYAGVFSLAIAFSNIFSYIGMWGVRGVQISDINGKYSNGTYSGARVISVAAAILVFPVVLMVYGYTEELALCCVAAVGYKILESIADLFFGMMQKMDRYDWIAVSYTLKGVVPVGLFVAGLKLAGRLYAALICMCLGYLVILAAYDIPKMRGSGILCPRFQGSWSLLKTCFPLMLNGMVNAWLVYLPRHAIQSKIGSEMLGYYGSISTIVVILSTLSMPVYGVILPDLSACIDRGDIKQIRKYLRKAFYVILLVSLMAFALGELLGPWALSLIYGKALLDHMDLLTPVMLSAVLLLAVGFFDSYFIPLNRRGWLLAANLTALAVCGLSVGWATERFGALGACSSMVAALTVRLILLSVCSEITLRKRYGT